MKVYIGVYHVQAKAQAKDKPEAKDQTTKTKKEIMAKRTKDENLAIKDKIKILMAEGYEESQATAIAFRMFRDGELDVVKRRMPRQATRAQDAMRKANTANAIYQLFKLVMKR